MDLSLRLDEACNTISYLPAVLRKWISAPAARGPEIHTLGPISCKSCWFWWISA